MCGHRVQLHLSLPSSFSVQKRGKLKKTGVYHEEVMLNIQDECSPVVGRGMWRTAGPVGELSIFSTTS